MTFLSYPKYYRNADDALVPVDTTLRKSSSPDWDYEVTAGIWTLRVRTDGTYQAEHEGDVFTYRLADLGLGRGDGFRSLNLGEPDFSRFSVLGDRIRWADVFPDVDFEVRYINDIMKVDVIVKKNRLDAVKSAAGGEFLTAKFDIPGVSILGEARQGGQPRDLYADALEIDGAPLEIVRDGKVLHKMKPVEIQYLDQKVGAIDTEQTRHIRTAQNWKLNRNAPGAAELSVYLDDVVDSPSGLVIDPTILFDPSYSIYDAYLDQNSPSTSYGGDSILYLKNQSSAERRILIGVANTAATLAGRNILSASLYLYNDQVSGTVTSATARGYKNTHDWYESSVQWGNDGFGHGWNGGEYTNDFHGRPVLMNGTTGWKTFDISQSFKSHYSTYAYDPADKGFLVKLTNTAGDCTWRFPATEAVSSASRPYVIVETGATRFGVYPGPGNVGDSLLDDRVDNAYFDKYQLVRYLDHPDVPLSKLNTFCNSMASDQKAFVFIPIGNAQSPSVLASKENFADHVIDLLDEASIHVSSGKIVAVEIGGEEEGKPMWWEPNFTIPNPVGVWFGSRINGASFSKYYTAAYKAIKNSNYSNLEIWSGGSVERQGALTYPSASIYGSCGEFYRGFIAGTIEQATLDGRERLDYLPDALSIHTYSGQYQPEMGFSLNDNVSETEFFTRLTEMKNLCNEFGWLPNFTTTEYGYSPVVHSQNVWCATPNGSEVSQSIYYLRSCLMVACTRSFNGIGWGYSSYFTHHNGHYYDGYTYQDFGFHQDDAGNPGEKRAIKDIAQALWDPSKTPSLQLQAPETLLWVPLARYFYGPSTGSPDIEGYAWCGWETETGQKWGAIWRYKNQASYSIFSESTRNFEALDTFSSLNVSKKYRFSISSGSADLIEETTGTVTKTYPTGKVIFSIPNVTENPLILKFN